LPGFACSCTHRSELEQKEWGAADDEDEADDELFKAFKVGLVQGLALAFQVKKKTLAISSAYVHETVSLIVSCWGRFLELFFLVGS